MDGGRKQNPWDDVVKNLQGKSDPESVELIEKEKKNSRVRFENETEDGPSPSAGTNGNHGPTSPNINIDTTSPEIKRLRALFSAIKAGNIEDVKKILDETPEIINSSSFGGLTPLHATCHMQQLDVLKLLVARGAKVNTQDSLGTSALHTAVKEIWHDGVKELLLQGAPPSQLSQPPSNFQGGISETPLHLAVKMGDKVSTSLLLKCQPDLSIRDGNKRTVFHIAASSRRIFILKEILADTNLQTYMRELDEDGDTIYHAAFSDTSGNLNQRQILKTISCIYSFHKNLDQPDKYGETPLYRACYLGLPDVVKFFLDHGADPAKVNFQRQSTIHAACMAGNSDALQHLLDTGDVKDLISSRDKNGDHPFYYATKSSSHDCCKLLLENGERLANGYKDKISNVMLVARSLSSAESLFRDLFSSCIKLSNKPKHHPDYSITFDYSSLLSSENKHQIQSSIISELADNLLETLIKHPLVESFLYIKWHRIRLAFYLSVFQYFVYLLIHTTFVMMTFGSAKHDWGMDASTLKIFRILHGIFFVIIIVPEIFVTMAHFKQYLTHWETYIKYAALACSVVVISMVNTKANDQVANKIGRGTTTISTERMFACSSMVLGWIELMMFFGRFPALGAIILMVTKVGKSIFKFLFAFLSVLIGFTLGFHILFQNMDQFEDFQTSFVKLLMILKGEISYSSYVSHTQQGVPFGLYSQIVMSICLFLVTIIMSNLLTGLAVKGVTMSEGKVKRLIKQASYLIACENLLAFTYKLKCFPRGLRLILSSRLTIGNEITIFPNKECKKHKWRMTIPKSCITQAMSLGSCVESEEFLEDSDDDDQDVAGQLRSFKKIYASERNTQKSRIKDLSVMCSDIKKQLVDLTHMIQQQNQGQNPYTQLSDDVQDKK